MRVGTRMSREDHRQGTIPARSVRVEDELWNAAMARTAQRGETVSDVVRRALRRYVGRAG